MSSKVTAFITSRWNSKRLPGKALADICGKPLLQRVIDRVDLSCVSEVGVLTTRFSEPIIAYCDKHNIFYGVGHTEEDVFSRICGAASAVSPFLIVRIWGDCPFVSPEIINTLIDNLGDSDLIYNVGSPSGTQVYVYPRRSIETMAREATPLDIYHFNQFSESTWFSRNGYKVKEYPMEYDCSINLSVDNETDLARARMLYGVLPDNFSMEDVVANCKNM